MFQIPGSSATTNETKNGHPVVSLEESKETLELLLRFSYPPSNAQIPSVTSLPLAVAVLKASIKYNMEGAEKLIRKELVKTFLESEPLRLFALACHHGLEDEMRIAAQATLRLPLLQRDYVEELEFINAGVYYRLQEYHMECGKLASEICSLAMSAPNFGWIENDDYIWFNCAECARRDSYPGKITIYQGRQKWVHSRWWWEFILYAGTKLKAAPSGATLRDPNFMTEIIGKAAVCSSCRGRVFKELKDFIEIFAAQVEKVTKSVVLNVQAGKG